MAQSTEKGPLYEFLIKENPHKHPRTISRRKLLVSGGIAAVGLAAIPVVYSADRILGNRKAPKANQISPQPEEQLLKTEPQPITSLNLVPNPNFSELGRELVSGKEIAKGWTPYPDTDKAEFFPNAGPNGSNIVSVKRWFGEERPAWISNPFKINSSSDYELKFSAMHHNPVQKPSEIKPLVHIQLFDSNLKFIAGLPIEYNVEGSEEIWRSPIVNIPRNKWPQEARMARIELTYQEDTNAQKSNYSEKIFYSDIYFAPIISA